LYEEVFWGLILYDKDFFSFLFVRRRRVVFAFLGGLVLDCFSVLGLGVFAGCVWKSQRTSQNVWKSQSCRREKQQKTNNVNPMDPNRVLFIPFNV